MSALFIILTILLTVYGQIALKLALNGLGNFPTNIQDQLKYIILCFTNWYVLSSYISAFLASLTWMAALSKLKLSYAYPFMSLSFIIVFFLSAFFFNERITLLKLVGTVLVVLGLILVSYSK